ncbi:uncharacterized protein LOC135815548 [Sycon ciliatum]|uniref:uncharacterized protein LOC135815548 n=1 Tax=Sycon ciliatum TaxID=27933 RepID=UPI0020AD658E|eukprot:scpid95531/ scgid33417/ 60S acidic ribosomal protein P1; AfP1
MSTSSAELACVYAALILNDDGVEITAEKIQTLVQAAKVEVEPFWAGLFAKALEGRDVGDLIGNIGSASAGPVAAAAPAAAAADEKKEEKTDEKPADDDEDSDDEFGGLSLFGDD